jgi:hypothetical protein
MAIMPKLDNKTGISQRMISKKCARPSLSKVAKLKDQSLISTK